MKTRKMHAINRLFFLFSLLCVSCSEPSKSNNDTSLTELISLELPGEKVQDTIRKSTLEHHLDSLGFIEIQTAIPSIKVDLKYAGSDNCTGAVLYTDLSKAYLHPIAVEKLSKAQALLQKEHPDMCLLVYDAARPLSVQKAMFDAVKDTKYRAYVADPSRTGLHNYGLAIDLTICDSVGNPLDMGTDFDYFGKLAGINEEDLFLKGGLLSKTQVDNRRLLRQVMLEAGFRSISGEWWHFNALSLAEAKRQGTLIK